MRFFLVLLSVVFLINDSFSQQRAIFPQEELFTTGAYYYPEHWDEDQWERDLENIANMGFEYTHFGEFSWVFSEPKEDVYTFEWLDKALNIAHSKGLKVIMCTPTPCPPAWMSTKYPDIYRMDKSGKMLYHGSRGNYSMSSAKFRELTEKIVIELAKRYGEHPAVMGWQLDNEPNSLEDFSPNAQEGFRKWLKEKYQNIARLNEAWGTKFWGVLYDNFEQINIPDNSIQYGVAPNTYLDYNRFLADTQAEFLDFQAKTLRKFISEDQWITSNYIHNIGGSDPRRPKEFDFSCYTMYPVSGQKNLGEKGFRLGIYNNISFAGDFYRSIKNETTGVMELQPGQVNWAGINPIPEPGAINMWLWNVYAMGGKFACTYRYRQPLYGSEQYHHGIVKPDGVTPSQGGKEYAQFIKEINKLRSLYNSDSELPKELKNKKTAILWSHDNMWDINIQKRTSQWDVWSNVKDYYDILKSFGCPVDIISEEDNFKDYDFLLVPSYQMIDEQLVEKWQSYADNGGHLILTCRTGHKTRDGYLFEAKWAEPIHDLIGAEIEGYDLLLADGNGLISFEGNQYHWNNWGEQITAKEGTEILAIYDNQFYKGTTAATTKKSKKGSVTYLGVDTDDKNFEKDVLSKIYNHAGASLMNYPKGVFVEWEDGFYIAVNYTSEPYDLPIDDSVEIIFGEKKIPSPGVTVWRNKE